MLRAEIDDAGRLVVDLWAVLMELSPEGRRQVADALSCRDDILADVTAQLLDGSTEAGSSGREDYALPMPAAPLSAARQRIALAAGEVASRRIRELTIRAMVAEEDVELLRNDFRRAADMLADRGVVIQRTSPLSANVSAIMARVDAEFGPAEGGKQQ